MVCSPLLASTGFGSDMKPDWLRNFVMLTGKFSVGYLAAQAGVGIAAFGLAKFGINLSSAQWLFSLALLFGSVLAGLFSALTPWRRSDSPNLKPTRLAELDTIAGKKWQLCLMFGLPVIALHSLIELVRPIIAPQSLESLSGEPWMRVFAMFAIVVLICQAFLPMVVADKRKAVFRDK